MLDSTIDTLRDLLGTDVVSTDAEVLAELALAARAMPPHHAQLVLAELRKRGLAA